MTARTDTLATIRRMAAEGCTHAAIAGAVGLSRGRVSQIVREHGIRREVADAPNGGQTGYKNLERRRIVIRCVEAGCTAPEAAAATGIRGDVLRKCADRMGLRFKPVPRPERPAPRSPNPSLAGGDVKPGSADAPKVSPPSASVGAAGGALPAAGRVFHQSKPERSGVRRARGGHSKAELMRRLGHLIAYLDVVAEHPEDIQGVKAAIERHERALGLAP